MAIAKIVYKESANATPVTWMDVTGKTVTAGSMLNGVTALKNDGTDITGSIASKTSSDLTANNLTVTAPAGYYASAATKTLSDQNLTAENIKKDVTIFGTTGSYEGSGGGNYQQKTVTPTTSQQVITADSASSTTLAEFSTTTGSLNFSNMTASWSITWDETPVVGHTYHITLSGTRPYRSRTYSYDADVTWTGFPFTISPTVSPTGYGTETFTLTTTNKITHQISDDDQSFSLSFSFTEETPGYDALSQVTVLAIPGDGTYAKTVIVPQQTVSGSMPTLTHNDWLADGDFYLVTIDGTEYMCTAQIQWSTAPVIGDMAWYYGTPSEYNYPFAVGCEIGVGMDCVIPGSGSHSIKVEKIDFS